MRGSNHGLNTDVPETSLTLAANPDFARNTVSHMSDEAQISEHVSPN